MPTPPDWKALGLAAFRDFEIDGVPSSGVHEPLKSELRAFINALATFVPQYADDVTGTSRTLTLADNGYVIPFTAAEAVTVTVPEDLPRGWSVTLLQLGGGPLDGFVTVQEGGGCTLVANADAVDNEHRTIDGAYGFMTLLCVSNGEDADAAVVVISGDTRAA